MPLSRAASAMEIVSVPGPKAWITARPRDNDSMKSGSDLPFFKPPIIARIVRYSALTGPVRLITIGNRFERAVEFSGLLAVAVRTGERGGSHGAQTVPRPRRPFPLPRARRRRRPRPDRDQRA